MLKIFNQSNSISRKCVKKNLYTELEKKKNSRNGRRYSNIENTGNEHKLLRKLLKTWLGQWVGETLENIRRNRTYSSLIARHSFYSQAS